MICLKKCILWGAAMMTLSSVAAPKTSIEVQFLGRYETGFFDSGGSEIVAHDPSTQRLFVINAAAVTVDVLDISNPSSPTLVQTLDVTAFGDSANSVAIHDGL